MSRKQYEQLSTTARNRMIAAQFAQAAEDIRVLEHIATVMARTLTKLHPDRSNPDVEHALDLWRTWQTR